MYINLYIYEGLEIIGQHMIACIRQQPMSHIRFWIPTSYSSGSLIVRDSGGRGGIGESDTARPPVPLRWIHKK